jgi:RHS repeat-associated protein
LNDERTPDGKKYSYLFDGLGSIVGMTDSSGTEVNSYDYDPYGQVINQTEQSGLNNPWKFAGGYLDSSTGLYKFGQRYYNPNLGRWTQLDSAGTGYVYAGDNPVNAVDPSGATDCGTSLWINGLQIIGELGVIAKGAWWIAGAIGALETTDAAELAAGGPLGFLVAIGQTIAFLGAFFGAVTVIKYYGNIIAHDCGLPISL